MALVSIKTTARLLSLWLLGSLVACQPKLTSFNTNAGNASFSKLVVLGGSYLSGYSHGGLSPRTDSFSIPALMYLSLQNVDAPAFRHGRVNVVRGIGLNSKPWESAYHTQSTLGYKTDCKGISALSPIKQAATNSEVYAFEQPVLNVNVLAVPFVGINRYTDPSLGSPQGSPYYRRMASFPGTSTLLGDAVSKNATFFIAWPGMDDIFNWTSTGGAEGSLPIPANFERQLVTVLQQLTANGAKGVVAPIPNFTVMPYYTTVAWNNADITQGQADTLNEIYINGGMPHIQFKAGRNGFVIADASSPGGYRQLHAGEYITLGVPLDSMKCYKYGLMVNVVNNRYVLDSAEVVQCQQTRQAMNAIIVQKASQYNLALADINTYMQQLPQVILADGVLMNSTFVSGNFFSLDGYHPTEKGYALLANQFIRAINTRYGSTLPLIHCTDCRGVLFP